jgi:hypothetical protein
MGNFIQAFDVLTQKIEYICGSTPSSTPQSEAANRTTSILGCVLPNNLYLFPQPSRENFPKVTNWTLRESKQMKQIQDAGVHQTLLRKRTTDLSEVRASMSYIQDADGMPISEGRSRAITARLKKILGHLESLGLAPPSWGRVSLPAAEYFYAEMYRDFPELGYCDEPRHWKAEHLVTDNYSGFYRNIRNAAAKKKTIKGEDIEGVKVEPAQNDGPSLGLKRKDSPVTLSVVKAEKSAKFEDKVSFFLLPSCDAHGIYY